MNILKCDEKVIMTFTDLEKAQRVLFVLDSHVPRIFHGGDGYFEIKDIEDVEVLVIIKGTIKKMGEV